MKTFTSIGFPLLSCMLVLAACIVFSPEAAWARSSKTNSAAKSTTTAAASTEHQRTTRPTAADVLASPEQLSGTITYVDPSAHEVTLTGTNGIPYDFQLTKRTRVELADKNVAAKEVDNELQKQATIHFVPTANGNVADSVTIG